MCAYSDTGLSKCIFFFNFFVCLFIFVCLQSSGKACKKRSWSMFSWELAGESSSPHPPVYKTLKHDQQDYTSPRLSPKGTSFQRKKKLHNKKKEREISRLVKSLQNPGFSICHCAGRALTDWYASRNENRIKHMNEMKHNKKKKTQVSGYKNGL